MRQARPIRHQEAARKYRVRTSVDVIRYGTTREPKPHAPLLTRSRLRLIIAVAVAAATLFCVTFVTRSPLFAIRGVRVTGLDRLLPDEAAEVRAASAIPAGTNFFRMSRGRLEAAVRRVPAVAGARISRRFPNRVGVEVAPRIPVSIVTTATGRWEVDAGGVAIRPATRDQKLPEIVCAALTSVSPGRRIDAPGVAGALAAARLTSPGARVKPLGIAKIEVDQSGDMCLNMCDSVAIRIGQAEQLETKLALVRRIYDERPDIGAEIESIDLRFPEAPACLPRGTTKHERESRKRAGADASAAREHDSAPSPTAGRMEIHPDQLSQGNSEPETDKPLGRGGSGRSRRGRSHRTGPPNTNEERAAGDAAELRP
jgi:cell division septal protein FtsQ